MAEKWWSDFTPGMSRLWMKVLVALVLMSGFPAVAQITLWDEIIWLEDGIDYTIFETLRLEMNDLANGLESELSAGRLDLLQFSPSFSSMTVKTTGLTFPDLTEQTSAAYSKSETDALLVALAPVEAWPMVCKTTVVDGVVPIDPASPGTLFCRSPQSGVPGGDIGSVAGVPPGYFFVVTDVLANCGIGENCDGSNFWVSRRNIVDSDTDIETWEFPLSDTTPAGDKLVSLQFSGPLMILEEGDYLVGLGGLTTSGGHTIFAQVMGYLTASPERMGR